jgi:hypothetical protein
MLAASQISAAPIVALMGFGVLVALVGHMARARYVVAVGLAILFLATAGMIIGAFAAYQGDESDPRPARPASEPSF